MERTLKVEKAEILLKEDKIVINDNAKKGNILRLISSSIWMLFGLISLLRYMKTKDELLLWSGVLIGLSHFIVLIFTLFRSSRAEIQITDIQSVIFKERFGRKFLDLKLKNKKIRRIVNVSPAQMELIDYFEDKGLTVK